MFRYISGVVLIIIAVWITLLTIGWDFAYEKSINLIQWLTVKHLQSIILAIVFFIIGFLMVRKPISQKAILVSKTTEGELKIAFKAMQDFITRSVSEFREYKISKCNIEQVNGELIISLYICTNNDNNLSDIISKMQEAVRQNVEKYIGIKVREVKLLIQPPKFYWLSTLRK